MLLKYNAKNPFSVNHLFFNFSLELFCTTLQDLDDLNHLTFFQSALYYSTEPRSYNNCVKISQLFRSYNKAHTPCQTRKMTT
jgi:hypothetical protein